MSTKKYYKKKRRFTKRRFTKRLRNGSKYKSGGASKEEQIKIIKQTLLKDLEQYQPVEGNKSDSIDKEDYDKIKKLIQNMSIETLTSKAIDGLEDFSQLSQAFLQQITKPRNKKNEMKIQLLIRPDTSKLYNKESSKSDEPSYESGDFIVNILNKDYSFSENIQKKIRSTDSLLANILNKCNDLICKSSHNPPLIAEQNIDIIDDRGVTAYAKANAEAEGEAKKKQIEAIINQ